LNTELTEETEKGKGMIRGKED